MQNQLSTPDVAGKMGLRFPLTKSNSVPLPRQNHIVLGVFVSSFLFCCNIIRSSLFGTKYRSLSLGFYLMSMMLVF